MIPAFAQTTPETPAPEIEVVEPSRPLSDFLIDVLDLDPDSFLVSFLEAIAEPVLQIVVIAVVAGLVLWTVRRIGGRVLDHATGRTKPLLGPVPVGRASPRRRQRLEALRTILNSILAVVVWSVALLTVLATTFGINLGPFLAGAGIVGIALGFGAQDLVKDFISGFFMIVEDQYGVGDIADVGEATGVVEGISLRTTRLRDVTGTVWHVPNGEIRRVGNLSQEWSRALLDIGVAYGTDIDGASEVIKRVADEMAGEDPYSELFLADPEVWGVETLGSDSIAIRLVIKTKPGEQWAISRELRRRIKRAFDDSGIEIPFPQRTVWLRRDDDVEEPITV